MITDDPNSLNQALSVALECLRTRHTIDLPSPKRFPKRASVAVIIAFRCRLPIPDDRSSAVVSPSNSFVEVQHPSDVSEQAAPLYFDTVDQLRFIQGDYEPHVLFIRRASRKGDRWSSHVALPGGKRESDESDVDAAIRETMEEVGVDITPEHAMFVGSLGQRPVTTGFGSHHLLTLCPYVFVLKTTGLPSLRIQESEVANAHWVPISNLLDPRSRAEETVDLSSRLAGSNTSFKRSLMRTVCGVMHFSAIRMDPSVSVSSRHTITERAGKDEIDHEKEHDLLLWGLTLGVIIDLLDLVQVTGTPRARDLWQLPTFSAPDLNTILWLLSMPWRSGISQIPRLNPSNDGRMRSSVEEQQNTDEAMDYTGTAAKKFLALIRPAIALTIGFRLATLSAAIIWTRRYLLRKKIL